MSGTLLDTLARHAALEAVTIESGPAFFETPRGERTDGHATVSVSRTSIAIRFATVESLTVAKAAYAQSNGRLGAVTGAWLAPDVNDKGTTEAGERLFGTQELVICGGGKAALTRLIFAGVAWQGAVEVNGRKAVMAPLSKEIVTHHDARTALVVDGDLDEPTIEAIDRASSFIAGLDLELLRVNSFSATGELIRTRHLRGYRRVGRGPHSPFTGIANEHRLRAWTALVAAIPRLQKDGVPIIEMINHIGSHNTVAEINSSSVLLLLTTLTAAYHRKHGPKVDSGAASRRDEMALLSDKLDLRLTDADLDRFERLRVELLDAGFFHAPGYETGRPQKDIKFLRDIAHMTVFRLCGYSGPFYGAEIFETREIPVKAS